MNRHISLRLQKWSRRGLGGSLRTTAVLLAFLSTLAIDSHGAAASGNPPGLNWYYDSGQESYIFPADPGMSSTTIDSYYNLDNAANVTITVLNSSATVVKTIQSGVSEDSCGYGCYDAYWDGTNDQGNVVTPGQYTIEVEATNHDGQSTIDELVDVANPGAPGSLTTPSNGATLQGTTGFVFTPNSPFTGTYSINQVNVSCIGASYAASADGTWQGSGDSGQCDNGSQTLDNTVYFTDPLGTAQRWSDPNPPSVTIDNPTPPSLSWYYDSGQESYIFPADPGMSSTTIDSYYNLDNAANVTITVLNSSATVVKTIQSGVSEDSCGYGCYDAYWDGTNDQGNVVTPGQYTIEVEATNHDGQSTIDELVDVANPGAPGSLTTPSNGATLQGTTGFVFTPNSPFTGTYSINQVNVSCIGASYAASADGTWQGSGDSGQCDNGSQTLDNTVYFTDPLGTAQRWSDPNPPSVTIDNPTPPSLSWYYDSGQESYIFPADPGMSSTTIDSYYNLDNAANVTITVLNSSATVVKTIQSGVSEDSCGYGCYDAYWDGTNDQGNVVTPGQYTIEVEATNHDGQSTIDELVDVANPGAPGSLTTPSNGATLQGTTGFVFTPNSPFTGTYSINQVNVSCIGASYAASADGTWQGSGDSGQCDNGSQTLDNTVYFTDPLGTAQRWSDPNPPSVTIDNPTPPSLSWYYDSGQESYIFPADPGMSSTTIDSYYNLDNAANVTITVLNSSATVVKTIQSGVSEDSCGYGCYDAYWDGTNDQGNVVTPGQYTIEVEATNHDGQSTIDELVDVANPGAPGSLTTPSNGATLQGTTGFVFTPNSPFTGTYSINQVNVSCIGASYAASADGTWQGSGDSGQCDNGSQTLDNTVYFTDPLGTAQRWSDPNPPSVTIDNPTPPSLSWYYDSGQESYIFPADPGMSSTTIDSYYNLDNAANVTITVLNSSATVVKTIQSGVSEDSCGYGCYDAYWDGTNDQGNVVTPGQYTIEVEATNHDGQSTIDELVDVANPGAPGSLTTPVPDGTLSGLGQFVFTPASSFFSGATIKQIDFCLSTAGCVATYNPSTDGTWRTTELTGNLTQGAATLNTTVYFTDPLGNSERWSDGGRPVSINTTAVPLQASLTPASGTAPLSTTLSFTASDPNGLPLSYTVNFGDGSSDATGTFSYPYNPISIPHTFTAAGVDTVDVSVSDGSSGFAQEQMNAKVLNATLPVQFAPSPASGTAPLATTFTLTTSDVTGQPVQYDVAFGDGQATSGTIGSPYSPITIDHTYASPGTFDAGVRVSDASGTTGSTISAVTASGAVALQPNAGEDQTGTTGTPVTLDGSGSQPAGSITKYKWSFGDGSSGSGAVVSHTYTTTGSYTATLTITANGGSAQSQTRVTIVAPPTKAQGLAVAVNDGSSLISGASVAVIAPSGARYSATTDDKGNALIAGLPDGSYTVYAYAPGFLPNTGSATLSGGSGSLTISLEQGSVGQTSATSTELTEQEIVAAGINPNDPGNQFVYQFDINLAFVAGPTSQPVQVCGDLTGNGVVNQVITESGCDGGSGGGGGGGGGGGWALVGGGGGGSGDGVPCADLCFGVGPYQIIGEPSQVQGEPAIMWMVIPGQAQWLKQFFDVKMVVSNLAPSGFSFDNGSISLGSLPSGLSLAPTAVPQADTQSVANIPAGGSATADWILRGDAEGFYTVNGNYNGTLNPVGVALSLPISTAQGAIHVWGGSAIQMIVDTDDHAYSGDPYLIRIGLENIADIPIYNADVQLEEQGRLNYIYQPQQQLTFATDAIEPGSTFWTDYYRLVPEITGTLDLSQSYVSQTGGNTEVASVIESHPATPPSDVPALTASGEPDGMHLVWQAPSVAGITSYEVFYTPTADTPFGAEPVATVPASTLSTVVANGQSGYYAVSAVINGVPTMYNALAEGTASSGAGSVAVDLTTSNGVAPMSATTKPLGPMSSGNVTLNPAMTNQPIKGVGGMLTDSAAQELTSLSSAEFQTVMNNLFGSSGADISILRIPIGANDFSPKEFTYDDMPAGQADPGVANFNLYADPDEADILTVLRAAEAINPNLVIIASPWTAPPWMKVATKARTAVNYYGTNETLNPNTNLNYVASYATYLFDFVKKYADLGIKIDYLTIQNEPGNTSASTSPGMTLSESAEAAVINDLEPMLLSTYPSTGILGYDWNWVSAASWNVGGLLTSPTSVAGTAWHCYNGGSPNEQSDFPHYPEFSDFITECSGHMNKKDPVGTAVVTDDKANFGLNLEWASQNVITGGLNNWASGVVFFNLALNDNCGPQLPSPGYPQGAPSCMGSPKNSSQCRNCTGLVTVLGSNSVYYTVDYWVSAQASAAFSQGAVEVPVQSVPAGAVASAAVNSDGTIGLYVSNQTSGSKNLKVDVEGEGFKFKLKPESVASFRWTN